VKTTLIAAVLLLPLVASAEGPLPAPPRVKVVPVTEVRATQQEVATGSLFPSRMLPQGFEVGGKLVVSRVSRGDTVKAGQLLGVLDMEIASAQVAQASAGVAAAEAGASLAVDVAGRNEKLKAEGTVSDVQARQVDTQARAAEAQLKVARAALQQAQAARRKHQLFAQFSGVLVDAPDQVGGMVGPGMPVYVIQQLDPLLLKTTIPETLRPYVRPGLRVRVESVAGTASSADATIKVVIPSADPQSRRIPVEITVPNKDGRFVANTLARVTFSMGDAQQAFIVPATALGSSGGEFVMAVQGNAVRRVGVTVTQRGAKEVTVLSTEPLREVVDYPTPGLKDGMQITRREGQP
jgi:RND family efflux transporter MFP subunit